ncbi:TPR-like protein [Mycena metata]|uniref:TPR-like protein n=1 Tax=Mycena metata TaxID=1033252 RepID=A0AAD7JB66_9AGAR|nr:TPR-like protein [Mycena metata]
MYGAGDSPMFKAGDSWNPYDPASLDFPPTPEEFIARMQAGAARAAAVQNDPQERAAYEQYLADAAAEREITGETEDEQMLREKREWAAADAKSATLKDGGNAAFKRGDYEEAYVIYTACMVLSNHEPLYPLNRAAVALKLKMYKTAVEDATDAMEKGDFNRAKALFRRAQGRTFLGEWVEAEEDYTEALGLQPRERNIVDGFEELKRLRSLPMDEQAAWISEQVFPNPFESGGEVKRRVEELLGYSLPGP